MGDILTEQELEFDFRAAITSAQLDEPGNHSMAHCMRTVDFLVEWPDEFWFVEIKDPSHSGIPRNLRTQKIIRAFVDKIQNRRLFSNELGPKLKDSFLYLYLSNRLPSKTMRYAVLLAVPVFDPALMLFAADELKISACLLGPDSSAWGNHYVEDVLVFNEQSWNDSLPDCPVRRL
jgi:hypothetical protein